jgi:hypothetical protein
MCKESPSDRNRNNEDLRHLHDVEVNSESQVDLTSPVILPGVGGM